MASAAGFLFQEGTSVTSSSVFDPDMSVHSLFRVTPSSLMPPGCVVSEAQAHLPEERDYGHIEYKLRVGILLLHLLTLY